MTTKKADSTEALVVVVKALEPLEASERQWVLQSAASRWDLRPLVPGDGVAKPAGGFVAPPATASPDIQTAIQRKDVRAFIRAKRPSTDVQRVACLVYFLTQTTTQIGFSSKEISKAHVDSGGSAINMTRALDNATRQSKYLSSRGPKEKQLTTLGEDVVVTLPNQDAVKEVESSAKSVGKRRKKKKTK